MLHESVPGLTYPIPPPVGAQTFRRVPMSGDTGDGSRSSSSACMAPRAEWRGDWNEADLSRQISGGRGAADR